MRRHSSVMSVFLLTLIQHLNSSSCLTPSNTITWSIYLSLGKTGTDWNYCLHLLSKLQENFPSFVNFSSCRNPFWLSISPGTVSRKKINLQFHDVTTKLNQFFLDQLSYQLGKSLNYFWKTTCWFQSSIISSF